MLYLQLIIIVGAAVFFFHMMGYFYGTLFLSYILFEVNYFVRVMYYVVLLRFSKRNRNIFDTFVTFGICTTTDLDFMRHMNNARYLREMDFNRIWFWGITGLFQEARRLNSTVVQSGCSIRYRKPVTLLNIYKVECRVLYWDERSMYLEQRMITVHDGFVRAIALTKQTAVSANMTDIVNAVTGHALNSPTPPGELMRWIESNDLSSMRLKQEAGPIRKPDIQSFSNPGPANNQPCACAHECACTCRLPFDPDKQD